MNHETQNRLKSPVFWTAIAAQILAIPVYLGLLDAELSETIKTALCLVLELMVTLGILNNPTNKGAF